MNEESRDPIKINKYQARLDAIKELPGYAGLNEASQALIGHLAYDKNLSWLDFNQVAADELAKASGRKKKIGDLAVNHAVGVPDASIERVSDIPRTFESARTLKHTYDDAKRRSDYSEGDLDDMVFYQSGAALREHMERLHNLSNKYRQYARGNSVMERRLAARNNGGLWVEHWSLALARQKVISDEASTRIYLNPKLQDSFSIYQEIFLEANRRGLRFQAKIVDPSWYGYRNIGQTVEDVQPTKSVRRDPIVFYPFKESEDEMLAIVEDVYSKHINSFKGRETGSIPVPLAPGLAVGDNVTSYDDMGLKESLTTHRKNVFEKMPVGLSGQELRRYLRDNHINPDNIAFNV